MKSITPSKLKSGDTIYAIAPASSFAKMKPSNLKKIFETKMKKELGLNVIFGRNVFKKDSFGSSSVKERVHDIHSAFKDKKIKGIVCLRGGFNSNVLLPFLDWSVIKNNPKPIWGYSDITVLLNAIYAKTGVITYSGPMVREVTINDNEKISKYIFEYFKKCIMNNNPFIVKPAEYFCERKIKARKNSGFSVLQNGISSGVIIGGNLCSLNLLQGTVYMPILKNKILFIEDDDFGGKLSPFEFERNFASLLQCKDANSIKGFIFGRFQKNFNMDIEKIKHILKDKNIPKNIPIIYNLDFGHTNPMLTFPIGGTIEINASQNCLSIKIVKH